MSDHPPADDPAVDRPPRKKRTKRKTRGPLGRRAIVRRSEPRKTVTTGDLSAAAPATPASGASNKRAGAVAIGIAICLVAGGIYLATRQTTTPEASTAAPEARKGLLDAIPAGALMVVTADVRALRSSPLAAPYLGGTRSVPGFDDVRQACGFDLIASVDEMAIAVPETGDADFGIVAFGGFGDTAILDCAAKVVKSRGGSPVTTSVGTFKSVRDVSSQGASGETAARPNLLLWGGGPYIRTMIEAADGNVPTLRSGSLHETLRADLSGFETVQASFVFSDKQRAVVADEIAKAQGRAPAVLAHITGAALGLRLVGDDTSVLIVMFLDDASRAPELQTWLEETRASAASGLPSRLLGAGPLLERVTIETSGKTVRARVDATVSEIDGIVDRAIKVRAMLQQQQQEAPAPPPEPSVSGAQTSAAPSVAPPSIVSARPR